MAPPDGSELIRRIRAGEGGLRSIPAIAVTKYEGTECYRAIEAGYQSCLTKPVNPETLVETILRLTKKKRTGGRDS
jgi:CheY-like chemotaxis protein